MQIVLRKLYLFVLVFTATQSNLLIAWSKDTQGVGRGGQFRFERNAGQTDDAVKYLSRGNGYTLWLAMHSTRLQLHGGTSRNAPVLTIDYPGARMDSVITGEQRLAAHSHYLIGNQASGWTRDIPNYAKVRYSGLYEGVDLVYYGNGRQLEYDFVVGPGANPANIRIRFTAASLRIDDKGDLLIGVGESYLRQHRPIAYQDIAGQRRGVTASYKIHPGNTVSFVLGAWDRTRELVIDPVLSYATYLGGAAIDTGNSIARDTQGNVYVSGDAVSANFPATQGSTQRALAGGMDTFVAKYDANGRLVWATYIGGKGDDAEGGIAVDATGSVYITGSTDSTDFPTVNPLQANTRGGAAGLDGYVAKLNPAGSSLVFSTYQGGNGDELFASIAVDSSGAAYVTGITDSTNFPVTSGAFQRTLRAFFIGSFVTKYAPNGGSLLYSTYLNGSVLDLASAVVVDDDGSAYIVGDTSSPDFPTTQGAFQTTYRGMGDVFVSKLNREGSQLVYSTLAGGNGLDVGYGIALDAGRNAYITGRTESGDFPTSVGSLQRALSGQSDAYVVKLNATGTAMTYGTYLGGTRTERGLGIAVDSAGLAYITGTTTSTNFPVMQPSQTALNGAQDAFVARLNANGSALTQSTYLGGIGDESGNGIVLATGERAWVAGLTTSNNFPVTTGAAQTASGGQVDAFLALLDFSPVRNDLTISPERLAFEGIVGGVVARRTFSIAAAIGAQPTWSIEIATTNGGQWLDAAPRSGSGSATVEVPVRITGLAAGSYNGTITVLNQATNTRTVIPVTLVLTAQGGTITQAGVVNGASFGGGGISPGLIVVVFGNGIGPATLTTLRLDANGKVATTLAETRFLFDGVPAPLIYVSDRQSSAIVPYSVAGKNNVQLVVEYRGVRSNAVTLQGTATSPAIFTANSSGRGQGAILNQDNSVNSQANPAAKSSIVILYVTGEGDNDPQPADGTLATTVFPKPKASVEVKIGGVPCQILYAGAAPGLVAGVMQINALVPENVPSGDVPVTVSVGGVESPAGVTVAVQ